jgi:excinuclease ABC subunit C
MISLREQVERISQDSGIYIFKDAAGVLLYIGKAKRLRARLLQYINGHDGRAMVQRLLRRAKTIEVTLTDSEKGALILEAHLIGKHKPPYNVRLLDGGRFLFLGINTKRDWPFPYIVRRSVAQKGEHLVGPYPAAGGIRGTLKFVERKFLLRTCSDRELKQAKRPCLQYQLQQCLAPCVGKCTEEEYAQEVHRVLLFLRGKNQEVIAQTKAQMMSLADQERFEEAAKRRDLIRLLQKTLEQQQVVHTKQVDRDIWGVYLEGERGMVAILPMRSGMMQEAILIHLPELLEHEQEALLSTILVEWYTTTVIPKEVLVEVEPFELGGVIELLSDRSGAKVVLYAPKRGEKKKQVELAKKNAEAAFSRLRSKEEEKGQLLKDIQRICQLPKLPRRMECFDISHLSGSNPVASMVTFVDGVPVKSLYRKFRIPPELGGDDYGSMRNVLERRLRRAKAEQKGWELPDLIVVDGGRGQLNIARAVIKELECVVPTIGIAKPRTEHKKGKLEESDKIILAHVKEPLRLPKHSPVLRLLQRLRDETHNQAVSFQAKSRQKKALVSVLDRISGLGPKRKKILLKHFGSFKAIKEASIEELHSVKGVPSTLAEKLYHYFHCM